MKFRKKPVVVEAMQFDGTREGVTLVEQFIGHECGFNFRGGEPGRYEMWIDTLEGGHIASPGDWIIKGVKGEFYPCKPDIFAQIYEPAEATPPEKEPGPRCPKWEGPKCPKCGSEEVVFAKKHIYCRSGAIQSECDFIINREGADLSQFFPPSPQERWVPPYEMKEPHSFVCSKCSTNFAAQFGVAFCPNCGTDNFRCACSVCKEKK